MNSKKFFELAKANGIEVSELGKSKSTTTGFSLFHHEIDNYSISSNFTYTARGIYKNKMGNAFTEKEGSEAIEELIKGIKESALLSEKEEEPIIFKGSEKYRKSNVYNKDLFNIPIDKKLNDLKELENLVYSLNKNVTEVQCSFEEIDGERELSNSYGLKLKAKSNYFVFSVECVCKLNNETKTGYEVFLDSDYNKLDIKELASKVVNKTISKFNGQKIESKSYKAVLNEDVTSTLIYTLINTHCDADAVQRKSSLFMGKLNKPVLSSKITIDEKPLLKNIFFNYFDDEGVATYNKKVIEKGILRTYFYTLETAKKDNVKPTGNGSRGNGKAYASSSNLVIKPGRLSEEDLFNKVNNGVYITSISGIHAGLNPQSGDFSLEAEGFIIKDGKKDQPLSMITISGNILNVFNNVIAIGNNSKLKLNSVISPSIAIKSIKISVA